MPGGAWLQPATTPDPLPVARAGTDTYSSVNGPDGRAIAATTAVRLSTLPQIGGNGVMVDLDYADRLALDPVPAQTPQIWLNDRAPADIIKRLTSAGLNITDDVTAGQVRRQLEQQGPAIAVRFGLPAAGLAAALAWSLLTAKAQAERAHRIRDLKSMRTQGVSEQLLARATATMYLFLGVATVILGVLVATLTWVMTGWALPLTT